MGIRIGRGTRTAVVAYAEDITLLLADPKDIPALAEALRSYENATGAYLNTRKSNEMATGSWNTTVNMMNIPYCTEMTIMCFQFSRTVGQSGKSSWTRVTGQVEAMAKLVYGRDLCHTQRIKYAHVYLFAKI